ncbi:MAG: prepilin-type N-terminal cleavage/methylation domain-containing protein [Treponema sp.]|nr:prepilin-type N-terminal cleavage/methylation domain-containing protein [Treponema sp.]
MQTEILKNKWKGGFTIVELMVVIIIVNVLSGVAIPKCTELIEKTREKTDLLKFYYLRDALNRALYEDDAYRIDASAKCGQTQNNKDNLEAWLKTEEGVTLFIIELHSSMTVNYQGENKKRTKDEQNMCGLMYSEGFWADAFREAGFGAVADIVKARANGDKFSQYPGDYYAVKDPTTNWYRTYPKIPIFNSRVLNGDKAVCSDVNKDCGQSRYSMKARWTGGQENSHSLEVFLARDGSSKPLMSRFGTCFSTQGCN